MNDSDQDDWAIDVSKTTTRALPTALLSASSKIAKVQVRIQFEKSRVFKE
jgi:hypothetical protein